MKARSAKIDSKLLVALVILVPAGLLLLLLVVSGVVWVRHSTAMGRMDEIVEDLRDQGVPVDNETIKARYDAETTTVNAKSWMTLLNNIELATLRREYVRLPIIGDGAESPVFGDWPQELGAKGFVKFQYTQYVQLQKFLETDTPYQTQEKFDSYATVWTEPELARSAAKFTALFGEVGLRDRDGEEVIKAIRTIRMLSQNLRAIGGFVNIIIQNEIETRALRLVRKGIERDIWNVEELNEIRRELMPSCHVDTRWNRCWQMERAMFLAACKEPKHFKINAESASEFAWGNDNLLCLKMVEEAENMDTKSLDVLLQSCRAQKASLDELFYGSSLTRMESIRTAIALASSEKVAIYLIRHAMLHRLAVTACAVRQYKKKSEAYPRTLRDLRALEIDPAKLMPLGNQPFGYQTSPDVVIWGFDPDNEEATPSTPPDESCAPNAALNVWRIP